MYKSLFGDLHVGPGHADPDAQGLRAASLQESHAHGARDDGSLRETWEQNLYVSGSPAQAMREHLARTLPQEGSRILTLADPTGTWAPRIIQALSDATGQPIQRLAVRDQATHRELAWLERTLIPRRGDTTLKLYHAGLASRPLDASAPDDSDQAPFVLMEHSDLSVVMVGTADPAHLDSLLARLLLATQALSWRCPALAFVVPSGILTIAQRIRDVDWPDDVTVDLIDDTFTTPSQAWNAVLGAWDRHDVSLVPAQTLERIEAVEEARAIGRQLRQLMGTAGIVGAAVADAQTGLLVAGESHRAEVDLARAAAALAVTVRAHHHANEALGHARPVEEIIVTAAAHQYVVRPLPSRGAMFMFALLDRAHSNLTLARLKVSEAQRNLD